MTCQPATTQRFECQVYVTGLVGRHVTQSSAEGRHLSDSRRSSFAGSLPVCPRCVARVLSNRELLQALINGDAERARELAVDHVATFEREMRSVL